MYKTYNNYDKYPEKVVKGFKNCAFRGYQEIVKAIKAKASGKKTVVVLDMYTGVNVEEIKKGLIAELKPTLEIFSDTLTIEDKEYNERIYPFVTDDRVFGVMSTARLADYFVEEKILQARAAIEKATGIVVVYGVGAALVTTGDIYIYCDLARWEIQTRFGKGMPNWKTDNADAPKLAKFKQGFFVEWRLCDRHKKRHFERMDFFLDTNAANDPKLITGEALRTGLKQFASEPFRLVPYFAPEVWGGQWMKEVCGLDRNEKNYAWAFDGVPEENSVFLNVDGVRVEMPSVNVVFYCPRQLLGDRVHARFGDEFPIRFDFLDTMGGQNLSLQVHPLTEYIQSTFGMHYTQDESYYILDAEPDAVVYLGVKTGVDPDEMIAKLEEAQREGTKFDADKYANTFVAKKHDHFLIPAGTIHCSGTDTMVLEISATPYIFTFKLWDWERLGLDGRPRPIHLNHGKEVIQWHRDTEWVKQNLVNQAKVTAKSEGILEEVTGLHQRQFVQTVRHTFDRPVTHNTLNSVNVFNLVEGEEATIKSPTNAFEPFVVHYAETFIIPESVGEYTIEPSGNSKGKEIKTIKAYVRT